MKLFAYEHPSGPVHEVEVTLGDTAHWRRLRRSNATTLSRRRHAPAHRSSNSNPRSSSPCGLRRGNQISGIPRHVVPVGSISHCVIPHRPYTKVIEAKKQHLSFRGKKLDDDAATLETIGIAPDYTLRTQSVTVSDK